MKSSHHFRLYAVPCLCLFLATSGCKEEAEPATSEASLPAGWVEVAPMPVAKVKHAAVLLDDGRVLIAGGEYDEGGTVRPSKSCEIYDPVANEWTVTTPMNRPRILHGILLMYDGRVLVWGGYDSSVGARAT